MPHPYPYRLCRLLLFLCFLTSFTTYTYGTAERSLTGKRFVLSAPTVTAKPSLAGTITIKWTSVPGATQYVVEYSKTPNTGFTVLKTVAAGTTSFRHTNLGYSETLYYKIKATGNGETVYSSEVTATTHPATYTYRIMPLGDSNTDGGNADIVRADRVAYRNQLYQLLTNAKYKVDFVGSEVSGTNSVTAFSQKYGFAPDLDHAGFGGAKNYTIVDLLKNGKDGSGPYLDKYNPEIVLLHIGTNSIGLPNNITELENILKEVDAYEARSGREVTIMLAQIIKQCTNCPSTEEDRYWDALNTAEYNQELVKLANQRIAAGDRIVLVNMADAGLAYLQNVDMDDYLHPNLAGYEKMATVWVNPVKSLLTLNDTHAPETKLTATPQAVTNNRNATFSFASNEADVTYQLSLDGSSFVKATNPVTLPNLPDGTHTVLVRAVDVTGNTDTSPATFTWTIDATPPAPPVILAVSEDRGPVNNDRITADNTLKLSGTAEANATVIIEKAGTGVAGTTKASASGTWEFSYQGTALANGSHTFIAKASDALNNISAASSNFIVTVDQATPTLALATTANNPVNGPFEISINASEGIYGLAEADFKVTNGSISQLKATDGSNYIATITPTSDGKVSIQLPAAIVTDLAGNNNTASAVLERVTDVTRPTIALVSQAAQTINEPFAVTITISEAVTGFDVSDLAVTNGTASTLKSESATKFTVVITPAGQGEVTVSIAADKMQDGAKNGNEASNILKRTFDSISPAGYAVTFNVNQVNFENDKKVPVTINNAEAGATYSYTVTSSNGGTPVTGAGESTAATITLPNLDMSGLKDGTLTITVYLTDKAGNKGEQVTAQVQKITKELIEVVASGEVSVPFDTEFSKVVLPQKVKVKYTTGEEDYLDVTWQQGNYNQKVAGKYTISGTLKLADNTTNMGNRKGSIVVEVQPNQPPTALAFSATTFKPNANPSEVLGTFTTEDPEDETFTYSLVSGEGSAQNSYFRIVNNVLHLVSNSGLSGITKFTIRVQSKDPYNNAIERTFILTKEAYEPEKLKLVNAFSPDGDGLNDTWLIPELKYYNQVELTILDRSGTQLYHSTDPEKGWDGKGKNGQVQEGPYFYILQIKDINLVQKGVVTVLK
ncbi:Ig-like domain-containing protein [Pontibacter sp. H259]|uniref:Ig-like domain-containing protein n=1 Tax=Pontibacter sp. H259 TaxID=3133421 RepID=UPI0030C37CA2